MGDPDNLGFWQRRFESGCDCGCDCDRGECDEPDPADRTKPDCLIAVCPGCGWAPIVLSVAFTDDADKAAFAREARRSGYDIKAATAAMAAALLAPCKCIDYALDALAALPGVADDQP